MKNYRLDKGIEIDAAKFLEWSHKRRLADVGGLMKLIHDAVENDDEEFLKRFPWIGKRISRRIPA